jgi:hypothetical protein
MTDGQLQKQILAKRHVNYLADKSVKIVISDAKREFPLVLQPETIDALQYEIKEREENVPLVARNENVILVLKWALKWFGDTNQ